MQAVFDDDVFDLYYDLMIGGIKIPIVALGQEGIFIFADGAPKRRPDIIRAVKDDLMLDGITAYYVFADAVYKNPYDVENTDDIAGTLTDIISNATVPQVSGTSLNRISKALSDCDSSDDEMVDEDGNAYVRHYPTNIWGMTTAEKQWYKVSDISPDTMYRKTALFGCLGYHKFVTGNYMMGFLYLITGGFLGIATLWDMFVMMRGNYSYTDIQYETQGNKVLGRVKEKIYLGRPDKGMLLLWTVIAVISAVVVNLVILPVVSNVLGALLKTIVMTVLSNMSPEKLQSFTNQL